LIVLKKLTGKSEEKDMNALQKVQTLQNVNNLIAF